MEVAIPPPPSVARNRMVLAAVFAAASVIDRPDTFNATTPPPAVIAPVTASNFACTTLEASPYMPVGPSQRPVPAEADVGGVVPMEIEDVAPLIVIGPLIEPLVAVIAPNTDKVVPSHCNAPTTTPPLTILIGLTVALMLQTATSANSGE